LVLIAIFAVVVYLFFVRPTVNTNRFVDRVNSGDLSEFYSLPLDGDTVKDRVAKYESLYEVHRIEAKVLARTLGDFVAFRRRIRVLLWSNRANEKTYFGDYILLAGAAGVGVVFDD
jgi:hypothetical protein